jgi:hypothetical protein
MTNEEHLEFMQKRKAVEPPMIPLHEQKYHLFKNNNGLVKDAAEKLVDFNANLNYTWAMKERHLFKQNLVLFDKNFGKIQEFLPQKSTQDCVQYFYREKFNCGFKELIRRSGRGRKKKEKEVILRQDYEALWVPDDHYVDFIQQVEPDLDSNDSETDQEPVKSAKEVPPPKSKQIEKLLSSTEIILKQDSDVIAEGGDDELPPGWTIEEKQKALRGQELFGLDYGSIAVLLEKKTEQQVKHFFKSQKQKKKQSKPSSPEKTDQTKTEAKRKPESVEPIAKKARKQRTDKVNDDSNRKMVSYWSIAERAEFPKILAKQGMNFEGISQAIGTKSTTQVRNYFYNTRDKGEFDQILLENGFALDEYFAKKVPGTLFLRS